MEHGLLDETSVKNFEEHGWSYYTAEDELSLVHQGTWAQTTTEISPAATATEISSAATATEITPAATTIETAAQTTSQTTVTTVQDPNCDASCTAFCGTSNDKHNGYIGETDFDYFYHGMDTMIGLGILLSSDDFEYTFLCCGRIDKWTYRVGNVGEVYLQVWRHNGDTWSLVGQNYNNEAVSVGQIITFDVPTNEEIMVKRGDVIGWYSPNLPVIRYVSGSRESHDDDWYYTTSINADTTSFDWTSIATHSDTRDFAIRADMTTSTTCQTECTVFCGTSRTKDNGYIGETYVEDHDKNMGDTRGLGILLLSDDDEYTFTCCGRIDKWTYRVGNVGDVYLQVWRNVNGTWELVGLNYSNESVSAGQIITFDVPTNEEIMVKSGDVIGWYSPSLPVLSYGGGFIADHEDDWYSTTSINADTRSYEWTTLATHDDSRDFAIRADMLPY